MSNEIFVSAERGAAMRAQLGVSDQAMTGAWRVIIARAPDRYRAWYYHENDDPRLKTALQVIAERWLAAQKGEYPHA